MNKTAVHIGLPKTGTTTLQETLFSGHPEISYLGQTNLTANPDAELVLKSILAPGYRDRAQTAEKIREAVDRTHAKRPVLMVSDEALTFGEFMLRGPIWDIRSNHSETAKAIKTALGQDAHIYIILRNQGDWMTSWYRYGLKKRKYIERDFNRWLAREIGAAKEHFFSLLDYNALYLAYCAVFGKDKVHVYFYEHYSHDFGELAADIALNLGIDAEKARALVTGEKKNATGQTYRPPPLFLKKLLRLAPLRKLSSLVPAERREKILSLISLKEHPLPAIPGFARDEIRAFFHDSNLALFGNLNLVEDRRPKGYL